jgi:Virulence-associated protein E/Bifunctional DNA primase/polymerase, N-terminal
VGGYGATREEWAHFVDVLGLTEDLLPVVSRPDAKIAPGSSLTSIGKVPSRYNAEHQVVGFPGWTTHRSTVQQVKLWAGIPDYGICVQARTVRALDVDIDDREACGRVSVAILEALGPLPLRTRAGSERALFAFRCEGPLEKRTAQTAAGTIELLADGQQFVAAGTHPSGSRYGWALGLPLSIPSVPRETLDALWASLGGSLPARQSERTPASAAGHRRNNESDPVVPWLEARGWIRPGRCADDSLPIWCPWAGDHTADSGPSETVYWPAGTGGYAQGHFKCLHAHCAQRTDDDFLGAIGFAQSFADDFAVLATVDSTTHAPDGRPTTPVAPPAPTGELTPGPAAWKALLKRRKGQRGFEPDLTNVALALAEPFVWVKLGWDEFRVSLMHAPWDQPDGHEQWAVVNGSLLLEGRVLLRGLGFEPVTADTMRDAVKLVAHRRSFDSAQLWLERLQWDGRHRVDSFLQTYCAAHGTPYERAVSRYLWSALAGRVLVPGVKADMVPILVGAQGVKKTSGIEALVPSPDYYVTIDLGQHDEETARRMRGRLVLEVAELRGLRTRDRMAINSFITERADTWVPKYEEFAQTVLRRGVFIGTSNDREFLDDETGNRRWLPVEVGTIDRAAIERDRLQLWAEGAAIFLAEGVVWDVAERLAIGVHQQFRISDEVLENEIEQWLAVLPDLASFSLKELLLGIGREEKHLTRPLEMRAAKILTNLGWGKNRRMVSGSRIWKWFKTNDLPPTA